MTNMPDESERGDLEPTLRDADDSDAKFRAALEKDLQREQYESGGFFLERLGAERYLDPQLMATLLSLRQRLIAEWGITTAAEAMLVDLAVLNYYHALRVQGWIGDLALHLEHQFFGQDAFATTGQERGRPGARRAGEDLVRRLGEQLQPL